MYGLEKENWDFKETKKSAFDTEVGGTHYSKFRIQPIQFSIENGLNFCQANVVKYICRYKDKGGKEDLEKAKHYIDLLMEIEYPEGASIE